MLTAKYYDNCYPFELLCCLIKTASTFCEYQTKVYSFEAGI